MLGSMTKRCRISSLLKKDASFIPCLRRSGFAQAGRIAQILNVPLRVRFRFRLGCGLADGLFEQPALGLLRCAALITEDEHEDSDQDHGEGEQLAH